ncbi:hypothetical protein FDZ73_04330 [bacterium]|nr:MAG: hypothetical protein FDZ73_04330 [bacterium]
MGKHHDNHFQIKDNLKPARIEAARRTEEYVEQPKTCQRRQGHDLQLNNGGANLHDAITRSACRARSHTYSRLS